MESTLDYVKLHLKNVSRVSICVTYALPLVFSIIGIGIGISSKQVVLVVSLAVINILMIILLATLLTKNTKENLILCKALESTDIYITFLMLAYCTLSYTKDVSILFFVYGIVLYLIIVVLSILNTRYKLHKSQGFAKKNVSGKYVSLVLMGGVVGRELGSIFLSGLDNSAVTSILAIILIILGGIFATASHLYYCYFLMKENKELLTER